MSNHFFDINHQKPEEISSEKEALEREETEIEELKKRIEKLEPQLRKEKVPEEREKMVKQEIESYLQKIQKIPPFAAPRTVRDEAREIATLPPAQQVGALISLVFEKSLKEAISVAQALNNPAILDEFHDILIDRYYQILIEKKILKPL